MKKVGFIAILCALAICAAAVAYAGAPSDIVTITSNNGAREQVELSVPYNPQRIAVMDLAALDMLDAFGLGDRVVGVSKGSSIDYLQKYVTDETIINLGTIKEADLEAVMSSEPDLIFIGGRLSAQYDALSEIAPVVYLSTDTTIGLVASVRKNAEAIASIFGVTELVADQLAGFDARIDTLSGLAEGKTALVGLCTSGSFNVLGNDGRCSIIGVEVGFENLAAVDVTSTHGNESSFELIVSLAPDYIFVMDRDAAINAEGAKLAREIMENELVTQTDAYKNDQIVYLATPAVWYTAEGGITALDVMLSDLEGALIK
ncbi:MAG: ABC transporter substrate-binding protein [Oscillospiraceae bacterium]|jgi:iron complex transport system substrate-binding protein|nr:ABC transporter substrate-binding protein [Oscillospiraceae bacterium]